MLQFMDMQGNEMFLFKGFGLFARVKLTSHLAT